MNRNDGGIIRPVAKPSFWPGFVGEINMSHVVAAHSQVTA